jgi:glycosyltransferase involved in cell wall biosynthesis
MKVLQVMAVSEGGVRTHIGELARLLTSVGHRVVLAGPAQLLPSLECVPKFDLQIGNQPSWHDLSTLSRLASISQAADVIHAHGLRAGGLAVAGALLAQDLRPANRRPVLVVTLHNPAPNSVTGRLLSPILARLIAQSDQVLAVSSDLIDWIERLGARNTIEAIVPAAKLPAPRRSPAQVRREFRLAPEQALLVTAARLAPQKGLDLAVHAARILADQAVPLRWLIAGQGPLERQLQSAIDKTGVSIQLIGRYPDMASLYAAADIVVNTSHWEGQALVLQEAMAAGAAIVATDVGGSASMLKGGAELVPPIAWRIAQAIGQLLGDRSRLIQLRRLAVQAAERLPSDQALLSQLETVYQADQSAADPAFLLGRSQRLKRNAAGLDLSYPPRTVN